MFSQDHAAIDPELAEPSSVTLIEPPAAIPTLSTPPLLTVFPLAVMVKLAVSEPSIEIVTEADCAPADDVATTSYEPVEMAVGKNVVCWKSPSEVATTELSSIARPFPCNVNVTAVFGAK